MTETIYDALRESHETQRSLLRRMLRTRDPEARRHLFHELRIELQAHEAAEERYLYVPMLMDDAGLDASRHALHEHHQIDELVEEVAAVEPDGDAWLDHARALSHEVHHHLREEERKFFQLSGKILDDAQKQRLAGRYRRDHARMSSKLEAG